MESGSKHPAAENTGRKIKVKQNKIHAQKSLFMYSPKPSESFTWG
jgi:hypothetical protein